MAIITRTIGTVGRNYSTITAWEADLDNAAFYSASDDAVGECYNDSVFDETFVINGGATIGLSSRKLSVASGERHDGTAGSGARLVPSSSATVMTEVTGAITTNIEWLEMDGGDQDFLTLIKSSSITFTTALTYNNMVLHNTERTNGGSGGVIPSAIYSGFSRASLAHNNIIYDIFGNRGGGTAVSVIVIDHDIVNSGLLNNTINNCGQLNAGNTAAATGVTSVDVNTGFGIVNNIVTDVINTGSGGSACYSPASPSTIDMDHNLSSDTTASGTGSLVSKAAANQYVSTISGSEDLHLKTGADAIDAGADLGTTPSGGALIVQDLSATTTITSPLLTQHNAFAVENLTISTALTEPLFSQNYILSVDPLESSAALASPALVQRNILVVDNLASATALTDPSFAQHNALSVGSLVSAAELTEPALTIAGALLVSNLSVNTALTEAGLTQHNILIVDSLAVGSSLSNASLAGTVSLSVNDLAVGTSISQPTLDVAFAILADNLSVSTALTEPALDQHNVLFVDDLSVNTLLSVVSFGGAVISCLSGYITIMPTLSASSTIKPALGGDIKIH